MIAVEAVPGSMGGKIKESSNWGIQYDIFDTL
jgi:hypothetical protein